LLGHKRKKKNRYKKDKLNQKAKCYRCIRSGLTCISAMAFVLFLSALFILGYDFLTQHPYFRIQHICVDGALRLPKQVVIQQAGIAEGNNILFINLRTAQKRLLAHPLIAEARVRRVLPSQIELVVREHHPLAILDLGRKFTINTEGIIYREADLSNSENLPVISGLEFADIHIPGQPDSTAFKAVMEVLRLGQSLESILPNHVIQKIHVDRDMGLTLSMDHSIKTIKLGYDNYQIKYKQLENVLYHLKIKPGFSDLDLIDLNNLNRIVVHPSVDKPPADGYKEV